MNEQSPLEIPLTQPGGSQRFSQAAESTDRQLTELRLILERLNLITNVLVETQVRSCAKLRHRANYAYLKAPHCCSSSLQRNEKFSAKNWIALLLKAILFTVTL